MKGSFSEFLVLTHTPALGEYSSGKLGYVGGSGGSGCYWSSSAYSWDSRAAYVLRFYSSNIEVRYLSCNDGYSVGVFE